MKIQAFHQIESTLSQNGVKLIFIGNSNADQTKEFMKKATVSVCGALYSDPNLQLYNLFNLKRGRFRSLIQPLIPGIKKYGLRGVKEGIKLGFNTSHLAGDSWQQGGTVVIDQDGTIIFMHIEEHPSDWPDMQEILPLIGLQDSSVDYKKAVADFLQARQAS